jgi:hypothetical protein
VRSGAPVRRRSSAARTRSARSPAAGGSRASGGVDGRRRMRARPATVAAPVGAVGIAFFVVQAALGWGLGVAGAGLTVLLAVMILGVLVVTDALDGSQTAATEDRYDVTVCAVATLVVAIAIACLYLPLPWGGLCAAAVLAALVVALRLL